MTKPFSIPRADTRVDHIPHGDPCARCGFPFMEHRIRKRIRPEHVPLGDPCAREGCGLPAKSHRYRAQKKRKAPEHESPVFMGIDGEGQGRESHKYVLLAASDADGKLADSIERREGLGTAECLDFILGLPTRARLFAYSFNYDLTMLLADLPNELLYYLFRPELRRRKRRPELGPLPIKWQGYTINLQGTRFSVEKDGRSKTIWDIWKFYQCRFTKALEQWNIGIEDKAYLEQMKMQRGEFDKLTIVEIKPYCFMECRRLATLAEKLVEAHDHAGLSLKTFYGAGSTGGAILKQMGVKKYIVPPPDYLKDIISRSFFGGRFENSRIGLVNQKVYSSDIASAYPYQLYFLPCLLHSRWERVTKRSELVTMTNGVSLVRYRLHAPEKKRLWGPFPFRLNDGSICFPESSGGGWIWSEEYLAGEAIFPNIEFIEAWNLVKTCDCRPFERIPHYYLERLRIGKEGAGWVFKLGPNSVYGKLAQSVGNGPYTNWILASLVTGGTRGHLLRRAGQHRDIDNILMLATDGMHSLENIPPEDPKFTGTSHPVTTLKGDIKRIPLGSWELKDVEGGVFYARPGVYFPIASDSETVRARGLGRATLYDNRDKIIGAWESTRDGNAKVTIGNVVRFLGAKSSISIREGVFMRSLDYGQWRTRPTDLSFSPMPKRAGINPDGTLSLRSFPMNQTSVAYERAIPIDAITPIIRRHELEEQPDLTLGVYEQ